MSQLRVEDVLKDINKFSIPGWHSRTEAKDVKLTFLGPNYVNTTALVELTGDTGKDAVKKLVYKRYGGGSEITAAGEQFSIQSPFNQSIVAYEYSRLTWGPHIYGLLENVRVEEFMDNSETLNPATAFTDEMIEKVADAYAKFHSMQLPITRRTLDILGEMGTDPIDEMITEFKDWVKSGEISKSLCEKIKLDSFIQFAFKKEIEWVMKVKKLINQRIVFSTGDSQYLNRLVCKGANNKCTRVVLIDYDMAWYMERGNDLAGHFISRVMKWDGESNFLSGYPLPSDKERGKFLAAYLHNYKKLCKNVSPTLDTLDNLTLEVDLHCIIYTIVILSFTKAMMPIFKAQPERCEHLAVMVALHKQFKDHFCAKYSNLVKNI